MKTNREKIIFSAFVGVVYRFVGSVFALVIFSFFYGEPQDDYQQDLYQIYYDKLYKQYR
jgi:hypothetical protein